MFELFGEKPNLRLSEVPLSPKKNLLLPFFSATIKIAHLHDFIELETVSFISSDKRFLELPFKSSFTV